MARCGCSGTCSCSIVAGTGVTIVGNGSSSQPYTISAGAAGSGLPNGGATGQALVKLSATNGDVGWATISGGSGTGLPTGGTTGQTLVKNSGTAGDATWQSLTKSMVGLGNVANLAPADLGISTDAQAQFTSIATTLSQKASLAYYVDGNTPPTASQLTGDNWIVVATSS